MSNFLTFILSSLPLLFFLNPTSSRGILDSLTRLEHSGEPRHLVMLSHLENWIHKLQHPRQKENQGFCPKMITDFKMATAEHFTKPRAVLHTSHTHEVADRVLHVMSWLKSCWLRPSLSLWLWTMKQPHLLSPGTLSRTRNQSHFLTSSNGWPWPLLPPCSELIQHTDTERFLKPATVLRNQ